MSKAKRESMSDWTMLVGAPILFFSEFMVWSHQFSARFVARYANTPVLAGIPRDPTAWQLYSVIDVLLALLAASLLLVALRGTRNGRIAVCSGLLIALAFTIHALGSPPTNGANLFDPAIHGYTPNHPSSGVGEVAALIGLVLGTGGVLLSFTAD